MAFEAKVRGFEIRDEVYLIIFGGAAVATRFRGEEIRWGAIVKLAENIVVVVKMVMFVGLYSVNDIFPELPLIRGFVPEMVSITLPWCKSGIRKLSLTRLLAIKLAAVPVEISIVHTKSSVRIYRRRFLRFNSSESLWRFSFTGGQGLLGGLT